MPISASALGVPGPLDIFRLAIPWWASMLQTEKKFVNSHPPKITGCGHLPRREGVLEVDLIVTLWQLRHIDQAAEALLDAAPVREEHIKPIRLIYDVGYGDILRRATHH